MCIYIYIYMYIYIYKPLHLLSDIPDLPSYLKLC